MVVLVQNNVLCKEMQVQKAALSKELDDIRKEMQDQRAAIAHDLLEFLVESQENFNTLGAQLSEIIAYINRGHDDKNGEGSSSRGLQSTDGRSRPGPRDSGRGRGSSSEPSRKRGSGYRGGGIQVLGDGIIGSVEQILRGRFEQNSVFSSSVLCTKLFGPQIDFTDDIHEIPSSDDVPPVEETTVVIHQISLPTAVPSTDYTEAFAQLRATVDKISLEQVQTRFHIDELKAALSKKISNLEAVFLTAFDNQDRVVLVQNNVLQNFNTLSAQLSGIIAYINRVRDDKWGKIAVVEVRSLLTIIAYLDLEILEEVEAAVVNRQGKEEVDIEEEEIQVLGDGTWFS
ncbi:hypothetical protein F511_38555 [Dorcoceras hygrometricum]|uniref:Uncharacterized protein n=1 Tax=Dorcoceras hygrometricum TaxID=472368 RepID=A0A2Z7DE04_9LAMI|nr:hypothetical protein F511_38555 [Dorcoceras hygrometricum]